MAAPKPHTHLVVDLRGGVIEATSDPDQAADDFAASIALGHTEVVDLAAEDVAALARIAIIECPALAKRGTGLLGAGTHPAQPYLEVMLGMRGVTAANAPGMTFGHDRVADVVNAFLSNAGTWKGETARAVKAALKVIGAKR